MQRSVYCMLWYFCTLSNPNISSLKKYLNLYFQEYKRDVLLHLNKKKDCSLLTWIHVYHFGVIIWGSQISALAHKNKLIG